METQTETLTSKTQETDKQETVTVQIWNATKKDEEQSLPQAPALDSFPEGGLKAWTSIFGAWLIQFCAFGYINAYGVYQDFYVREYLTNKTSAQISLIGSFQVFFAMSMSLVAGKLFDKGYFHHLMIGGSFLSSFSLFMLSISKPGQYYQVFLSQGIGQGIGIGLTLIPSMGIAAHYFRRKRGLAMGIVVSGSSVGATVHPVMINKLVFGTTGFHNGVRASAGLISGLLIIGNLLVRPRLPPKKDLPAVSMVSFAQDKRFVLTCLGSFLILMGFFMPFFFLQLDAVKHGIDVNLAFYTLAILNAASIFGRVLPSMFIDSWGVYNAMIPCTFICGILIMCMFGILNNAGTIMFSLLFGFFSGSFVALLSPMFASLAKNFSEIGARMGLGFTVNGIAVLIGSPVAGALLTDQFLWWRPIVFSGVLVLSGGCVLVVARHLVATSKGTRWV
ncbi:major facilitator superfamily domain-containing protein [Mycena floridula]|nr:major facilitator superfamily domain-containing protein [Mycena floridula]